jgi:HK97 family phage major capsid protein
MLAEMAGHLQQPVASRDEKALQTLSALMAGEVEQMQTTPGYATTKQFEEAMGLVRQLRADVDATINLQRNARRVSMDSAVPADLVPRRFDRRIMRFSTDELSDQFARFCIKLRQHDHRDLTPNTGGGGGFLIPEPQMAAEIFRMVESVGVAERLGRPMPLPKGGFSMARGLTGAVAYFKAAGGTVTESSPTFGQLNMTRKTLMSLIDMDIELEEDVYVQIGNFLATEFAYAMAKKTDYAAFRANGEPSNGGIIGLLNSSYVTQVTMGTNDTFSSTVLADLTAMEAAVAEEALDNARWLMHRTEKKIIKDLTATATGPIWQPAVGAEPATIIGYEHVVASQMPATTATAVSTPFMGFGDFSRGLNIATGGALAIAFDDSVAFKNLQRCWRAHRFLDISVNGYTSTEIAANASLANPIAVLVSGASG